MTMMLGRSVEAANEMEQSDASMQRLDTKTEAMGNREDPASASLHLLLGCIELGFTFILGRR